MAIIVAGGGNSIFLCFRRAHCCYDSSRHGGRLQLTRDWRKQRDVRVMCRRRPQLSLHCPIKNQPGGMEHGAKSHPQESSWITQETETATPDDKPKYFSTTGAVPARPRRSAGPEAFLDGGPKCLAPGHSRDTLNPLACLKPNRHNHTIGAIPPFLCLSRLPIRSKPCIQIWQVPIATATRLPITCLDPVCLFFLLLSSLQGPLP